MMATDKSLPKKKKLAQKQAIDWNEKPTGYWHLQKKAFLDSFRNVFKREFLQSAAFDLLTLLSLFILLVSAIFFINMISQPAIPQLMQVYLLNENGDAEAFEQALTEYAPVFSRVLWISLLITAVACLLGLFFISVFYGKAWSVALKKSISSRFVPKYYLLNLSWFISWLILLTLTLFVFKAAAAALALGLEMLIFLYTDPVLRAVFDEKKSLRKNLSSFFRIAKKFHWFVFFILISLTLGLLLMLILGVFPNFNFAFALLSTIFTLLFIGWMRNYIISVVESMHKSR